MAILCTLLSVTAQGPTKNSLVVKGQIEDAGAAALHFLALLQNSCVNLSKLVPLLLCLHLPFSCHVQLGCKFFGMWTDFFWSSENTCVCPYKHPARSHIRLVALTEVN